MAKEIARRRAVRLGRSEGIAKTRRSGSTSRKQRKKVAKPASKKQLKKAVGRGAINVTKPKAVYAADYGLMTAFHHMQRASVVMSLMEEGTGEELRDLLKLGVKLYRKAVEDGAKNKVVLQAIGVLRASEHLSMAGLYAARAKHKQKVTTPTPEWLTKVVGETSHRMGRIEREERGKGTDLFQVTVELLRQAGDRDHDAQLAFELAMAADALCFALENGL
jgi:hypothetical protein